MQHTAIFMLGAFCNSVSIHAAVYRSFSFVCFDEKDAAYDGKSKHFLWNIEASKPI